jgi:hypothetical protein
MRKEFDQEEIDFIAKNYMDMGPWKIADILGRTRSSITHKAYRLGLIRGVDKSNHERRNAWGFDGSWTYDLGYVIGTYLGDGNIYIPEDTHAGGGYIRLSCIDKEFCEAFGSKITAITGLSGVIDKEKEAEGNRQEQWRYRLCNKDIAQWFVDEFGGPKEKRIRLLPNIEANKGMIEGLFDSEGTIAGYQFTIRMAGNLEPVKEIFNMLGVKHNKRHKGVREEKWSPTEGMAGYSISIKEYIRLGFGTYIKRKAKNGIPYKGL